MKGYEIPLSPDNQAFNITLSNITYKLQVQWRDFGWVLDLMDSSGGDIAKGIPMVTGGNLLSQLDYLNLGFALEVACDDVAQDYPTKTDLGLRSHLYVITE